MMLGSDAREDKCRICGGDGSTCNTIAGTLDMKDLQVGKTSKAFFEKGSNRTNFFFIERLQRRIKDTCRCNEYTSTRKGTV